MSKYNCALNFEPSKELCYHETCCFDCRFIDLDGELYPCNVCAGIGGQYCKHIPQDQPEYWPQPHERC